MIRRLGSSIKRACAGLSWSQQSVESAKFIPCGVVNCDRWGHSHFEARPQSIRSIRCFSSSENKAPPPSQTNDGEDTRREREPSVENTHPPSVAEDPNDQFLEGSSDDTYCSDEEEAITSDNYVLIASEDEGYADAEVQYRGIAPSDDEFKKWRAFIEIEGNEIDGGLHWTKEDAARAYDSLAKMFLGDSAELNFPVDDASAGDVYSDDSDSDDDWLPPHARQDADAYRIPVKKGVMLSEEEIVRTLEYHKGENIEVVHLDPAMGIANAMIFVTGISQAHMQKMADDLVDAMLKRRLKLFGRKPCVEDRDDDEWMIVDCDQYIVQIMVAGKRELLALEDHWRQMRAGVDLCEGMTHDEFLEKYPLPDGLLEQAFIDPSELERVEAELGEMGFVEWDPYKDEPVKKPKKK